MNWTKVVVTSIVGLIVLCLGAMVLLGFFLTTPVTVVADETEVVAEESVVNEAEAREPVVVIV